jgi:hypothetical protein
MRQQSGTAPPPLDPDRGVTRHLHERSHALVDVGTVRLRSVNGMDATERAAMLAAGEQLAPVRHVRATVAGISSTSATSAVCSPSPGCTCTAASFGRLCSHMLAVWQTAH